MTTTTAKRRKTKRAEKLDQLYRDHPERLVECPECNADAEKACRGRGVAGGGSHLARFRELGLDRACGVCGAEHGKACTGRGGYLRPQVTHAERRKPQRDLNDALDAPPPRPELANPCPTCDAKPGGECKTAAGRPLKLRADGQRDTHAARRTEPLKLDACLECQHDECPIVPDCSACPTCAAARSTERVVDRLNEGLARESSNLEDGDAWLERQQKRLERSLGQPSIDYIALADVREDGGTQTRARISDEVVVEYADAYRAGAELPPPVVYYDGKSYWLADGFHRCRALRSEGISHSTFEVRQGTVRDARLHSAGANAHHGLRRTNADKRRAVEMVLRDEEWSARSNRWIAEKCAVSDPFVGTVRREVQTVSTSHRVGQDGKAYPTSSSATCDASSGGGGDGSPAAVDDVITNRTETDEDSLRWSCQWCDAQPGEPCRSNTGAELPGVHRGRGAPAPEGCGLCYDEGAPGGCVACRRDGDGNVEEDGSEEDRSADQVDPSAIQVIPQGSSGKPRTWREVLEIGPGRVEGDTILEHHARLCESASAEERAELDLALACGLSAWDTRSEEADAMVKVAEDIGGLARGARILEPSAGGGALVAAVRRRVGGQVHVSVCEINPPRVDSLRKVKREVEDEVVRHGAGGELDGSAPWADVIASGDFLKRKLPSRRYDLGITNPPYERGLDGRFLERLMECCDRVVALLRLNALTGRDRHERVWSQVEIGAWHLRRLVMFTKRPGFDGPGQDSAQSDYVIVGLERARDGAAREPRTMVEWR